MYSLAYFVWIGGCRPPYQGGDNLSGSGNKVSLGLGVPSSNYRQRGGRAGGGGSRQLPEPETTTRHPRSVGNIQADRIHCYIRNYQYILFYCKLVIQYRRGPGWIIGYIFGNVKYM